MNWAIELYAYIIDINCHNLPRKHDNFIKQIEYSCPSLSTSVWWVRCCRPSDAADLNFKWSLVCIATACKRLELMSAINSACRLAKRQVKFNCYKRSSQIESRMCGVIVAGNRIRQHDLSLYWGQVNFNWLIPWLAVPVCTSWENTRLTVCCRFYRHTIFVQCNSIWSSMKPNMLTMNIREHFMCAFCKLFLSFNHKFESIISFYLEVKQNPNILCQEFFSCVSIWIWAHLSSTIWHDARQVWMFFGQPILIIRWEGKISVILWSP